MMQQTEVQKRTNQSGFASITVALTLVIVLALLSLGFAQLARREQQNAISKQLAAQANYAAESGVNDAVKVVETIAAAPLGTYPSNKCLPTGPNTLFPNSKIGPANKDISYRCVLVNTEPPTIDFDAIPNGQDQSMVFTVSDNLGLGELTIGWGSASGRSKFWPSMPAQPLLTPSADWQTDDIPSMLQVSFTKLGAGAFSRQTLISNTHHFYLYPSKGGFNSLAYLSPTLPQAPVVSGNCNMPTPTKYPCSVRLTNIGGAPGEKYLVHVVNYYDKSDVTLFDAKDTVSGQPVKFKDGQADIDVTAKVRNVLKRIYVKVPIAQNGKVPPYAVESQGVCKRLTSYPATPPLNPTGSTNYSDNPYNSNPYTPTDACDLDKTH